MDNNQRFSGSIWENEDVDDEYKARGTQLAVGGAPFGDRFSLCLDVAVFLDPLCHHIEDKFGGNSGRDSTLYRACGVR